MWKSIILPVALPLLLGAVLVLAFRGLKSVGNGFEEDCSQALVQTDESKNLCSSVQQVFFKDTNSLQEIAPESLGAPKLEIDSKLKLIAFHDYREVARVAYCFFVHKKWFDPERYTPNLLAQSSSGFAIWARDLPKYKEWLEEDEGRNCLTRVRREFPTGGPSLLDLLEGKVGLIAVNPFASVSTNASANEIIAEAKLTLNHERVHAIHEVCSGARELAEGAWKKSSPKERKLARDDQRGFRWDDPDTAVREFFALKYEKDPRKLEEKVSCN